MLNGMKSKLFAILMAMMLIVTLMPTAAFAEEPVVEPGEPTATVAVQSLKVAMLEHDMDSDGNKIVIEKELAKGAEFKLTEKAGTRPQSLTEYNADELSEPLREYTGTVKYEGEQAVVEFDQTIEHGTYTLTETTAPTRYLLSENSYEIVINTKGATTTLDGEWAPIPETGFAFEHAKKAEVTIPIEKKVTGDAAPDETFTAKLSVYRFTEPVSGLSLEGETGTTPTSEPYSTETAPFTKDTKQITFYIDWEALDGAMLYLEEVNDGKTGWTYDPQVYFVEHGSPESEVIAHALPGASGEEPVTGEIYGRISKVEKIGEIPSEAETVGNVATFTNTYTKPYNGGGSTTRYYNVKVNNGKALSITGAELSRVVAGTTIHAVADPAAEGKVFKGWEVVKGGITVGETDTFSFAMPREDVELTAVYADKEEPVTPEDPEDPEGPVTPDDEEEQPKDYDGPVPKTGDTQATELAFFAALMLMAAFGLKKAYNK